MTAFTKKWLPANYEECSHEERQRRNVHNMRIFAPVAVFFGLIFYESSADVPFRNPPPSLIAYLTGKDLLAGLPQGFVVAVFGLMIFFFPLSFAIFLSSLAQYMEENKKRFKLSEQARSQTQDMLSRKISLPDFRTWFAALDENDYQFLKPSFAEQTKLSLEHLDLLHKNNDQIWARLEQCLDQRKTGAALNDCLRPMQKDEFKR